ncbi:hypothetical protein LTR10_018077 [Elasticomyces elasticus]|uniref:SGNH hydrolase-type esterase domain-containing protein n=1 Tax=Exophiala sideris TaxID=1016849 RepID=A0ABR0JPK3_9EURO|nr:hypothetical protein LTR10_018077 [Elasticomyces elasticus]KAK5039520.1 hypothetical protein LTS07_000014 [Exophiala sideris]KAK5041073.1 hypothetical protein LTR13_002547 [Exophiala sideris]KAK5067897.1 hypothetical protein LTR69_000014 [Exophiala sideris]KAK5187199.1 hypothetical protein LTR44_000014 [Eurotiomycetes sp. CCFEE 6388]
MPAHHIAAIGSSFAAGPSIPPIIDSKARRSGNNYPHLLAKNLGAEITDLTSSGATLLNILREPQCVSILLPKWFDSLIPPQLDGLPEAADIVTLTAGGNDLGYSKGMLLDAMRIGLTQKKGIGWLIQKTGYGGDEASVGSTTLEEVRDRLVEVFDRVHEIAPQAKIYLVDYVNVFGPDTKIEADQPLPQKTVETYIEVAKGLAGAYQEAADLRPDLVRRVAISEMSQGHELGSAEPWVTGFTFTMLRQGITPYHPNAKGHVAIAEVLHELIEKTRSA